MTMQFTLDEKADGLTYVSVTGLGAPFTKESPFPTYGAAEEWCYEVAANNGCAIENMEIIQL